MMKRLKMDVSRTSSSSLYSGAMVPNVNANVQQLYFQFLSDPMNEAQLLQDKKLIAQGLDPSSVVPFSRQSLDDETLRDSLESRSPTTHSRPSTPPPCSPASSPSSSPRRSLFSSALRKRKKSLGKSPLALNEENSGKVSEEPTQKFPLSPRENFVSERRPKSPAFSFVIDVEESSTEALHQSDPTAESSKAKQGLSLEKKVLQSVSHKSSSSNSSNSNSGNASSKSKSPSPVDSKSSPFSISVLAEISSNKVSPLITPSPPESTSSSSASSSSSSSSQKSTLRHQGSTSSLSSKAENVETHPKRRTSKGEGAVVQITENKTSASPKEKQRQQQPQQQKCVAPQFYFPRGKPNSPSQLQVQKQLLAEAAELFKALENGAARKEHFGEITKALCLPLYWKSALFRACGGYRNSFVTLGSLTTTLSKLWDYCSVDDEPAQLVFLLRGGDNDGSGDSVSSPNSSRDFLTGEDLTIFVQDVVDSHPGLKFLHDSPAFISRYVATVISRITYVVNSSWSDTVSLRDLRHDLNTRKRSSLLASIRQLEETDDINLITEFFSYEHFYVIYCKFWELDRDHDLKISKAELAGYNNHSISDRMIDRIFSAAVNRNSPTATGQMCYQDFVWFILSSEDKRTTKAVEFWFRCMDLDGDGKISMYELEYFYEEQLKRLEAMCIEPLSFENLLCQMLDLIHPVDSKFVTLVDLKRKIELVHIFFDTFFDLEKYLDHENKDSFAVAAQKAIGPDGKELSEWEKFALDQYRILVTEDDNDNENDVDDVYEDDFEVDELTIEDELKVGVSPEDDDVYASLHQLTNAQNIQL